MGVALDPALDGRSAYCLVPRAMFFEFLPLGQTTQRNAIEAAASGGAGSAGGAAGVGASASPRLRMQTLLPHEVTVGTDYELVVTTLGGLCRYRIGDVVRVVGRHRDAPLVEFRYRKGQLLNLRGEKTSEPQLAAALDMALDAKAVSEYTTVEAVPRRGLPFYRVFVERTPDAPPFTPSSAPTLDAALGRSNPIYATWRAKGAIGPCQLVEVTPGSFEALRAQRLAEGASPQQLKVSRVLRSPHHEELLCARALANQAHRQR